MRKYLYKPFVVLLSSVLLWTGWTGTGHAKAPEEAASVQWSHLLESNDPVDSSAGGKAVVVTSDGGYIAVGFHGSSLSDGKSSYVVKVNSNGEVEWEKEIDVLHSSGAYASNQAFSALEASDGSIFVGGEIRDIDYGRPRYVPFVFKLSPEGELLWEKAYPDMPYYLQSVKLIQETSDGGVFAAGEASRNGGDPIHSFLLKINTDGDLVWSETYSIGFYTEFESMVVTSDDGVIAAGWRGRFKHDWNHPFMAKISPNGELAWLKTEETDEIRSLVPFGDGSFLLTRYHSDKKSYDLQNMTEDGDLLWEKTSDSLSASSIGDIVQTRPIENGFAVISKHPAELSGKSYEYQITLLDEFAVPQKTYLFGTPGLNILADGISLDIHGFVFSGEIMTNTGMGYRSTMQLAKIALPSLEPSNPELAKIEFQTDELKLGVGQSAKSVVNAVYSNATVTDVTYSAIYESLDPGIASVDPFGNITGVRPGTTIITAAYEGMQASVTVEVTEGQTGPGRFFLDSDEYSLSVGTELDVAAYFTDESGLTAKVTGNTVFAADDPAVAVVDEYGNIRGISPGITHITATYNGHTYRASVWVVRPYHPL